jgi:hypothetical protein
VSVTKSAFDRYKAENAELRAALLGVASKMRDGSPCWCMASGDEDLCDDDEERVEGRYGMIHEESCETARSILKRLP